jgi:hypothetical protein
LPDRARPDPLGSVVVLREILAVILFTILALLAVTLLAMAAQGARTVNAVNIARLTDVSARPAGFGPAPLRLEGARSIR